MTIYALKRLYEGSHPTGAFFCPDIMGFFGDTMRNFGVRSVRVTAFTEQGIESLDAWEVYRKKPVGGLHGHLAYFRKDNGKIIRNHK